MTLSYSIKQSHKYLVDVYMRLLTQDLAVKGSKPFSPYQAIVYSYSGMGFPRSRYCMNYVCDYEAGVRGFA